MTKSNIKDPFLDPATPTLGDGLRLLETMPTVPRARLVRVRSAVATLSRLTNKSPDQIPAHLGTIARQIHKLRRQPSGLSRQSLANMKSEIVFLARTAYGRSRRSCMAPLSAPWLEIKQRLSDGQNWWGISRLASFSSASGINPEQIDDQIIEPFLYALNEFEPVNHPETRLRHTIRAWNRVQLTLSPALPLRPLSLVPAKRYRWTLEPSEFSESFRSDVEAWFQRLSAADPLAEDGPRRALRPETLRLRRHQIFKAASALIFSGRAIETITTLGDLVGEESFTSLMRVLLDRQGGRTSEALHGLAGALLAVARHHAKAPTATINRLARIVAKLDGELTGFRPKTRERLANFEDEVLLSRLLHLPELLLQEATSPRTSNRRAKLLAQISVAVEIEIFAPLRLKNLSQLNVRQQVRIIRKRGAIHWLITIDPQESKNRAALTYELAPNSVARISRAMEIYNPPDGWLFPGRTTHKSSTSLGMQIKQVVEEKLGVPFNVHLFRAIAGWIHLKNNPAGFEAVRALLGDRDDQVVRKHYTFASEGHLIAAAQASISDARTRTASSAVSKPRRRKASSD